MKFRNIFWGVVLIFLGVLFILHNLGLIYFDWMYLWRLWPVILVLWGISILPAHNMLKLLLTLLVLAGAIYFMVDQTDLTGKKEHGWRIEDWSWDEDDNENYPVDQSFNIPFEDTVGTALLDLDVAAGAFIIEDTTHNMLDFTKRGTKDKYSYVVKREDDRAVIIIDRDDVRITSGKNKHYVDLNLNTSPVWDFDLDVGAASLTFDLSALKVNNLTLDGGAAAIDIRLGDKYEKTVVNIDAGASSIEIEIPESSGCDLRISTVLSGKSIKGFKKLDHGHYQTENFTEAENKVYIKVDAAISSTAFIRY